MKLLLFVQNLIKTERRGQHCKIKKLSRKKKKLWDKYRFTKNNNDYEAYQNCLIEFNHEKEEAIRRYEKNVISNKDTNPKRYYRYVSSKEKYKDITISLRDNEKNRRTQEDVPISLTIFSVQFLPSDRLILIILTTVQVYLKLCLI